MVLGLAQLSMSFSVNAQGVVCGTGVNSKRSMVCNVSADKLVFCF